MHANKHNHMGDNDKRRGAPTKTHRRLCPRARVSLFADCVYDAAERAAVDMDVPRHSLKIKIALDPALSPCSTGATAYYYQSFIRVRRGPAPTVDVPSVDALLYHEMGHLVDCTGHRLLAALRILAHVVAVILAMAIWTPSVLLCNAALSALGIGIAPTHTNAYIALAAVTGWWACICWFTIGWCPEREIWRRLDMRISHKMEMTANRLAADALLTRRGDDGIKAVAAMLINLRRGADRGRKITGGHPPARVELRALLDHLQTAHRIQAVFGWTDKRAGKRTASLYRNDQPLCDATFTTTRTTRRYRRRACHSDAH
ncbi:hypothetical protein pmac_cds_337 [Pandoravirus macleodensis]|uniref:Uncharacterized protein n=1 Tax=Pandoravirus macleodensis TaxID=2107707 RepID=A0A2U7UF86_9VIRU|nr:hypothetical protein pmac_cds_337 [Pandoravirus macleodensis]AVK77025.1 hypothetical protein pmac_cds_337 [Pandoravirus macleodensis]